MLERITETFVKYSEVKNLEEKYLELLYAVESKHNGETRHETALKYIQQAEIGQMIAKKSKSAGEGE